MNPLKVFTRPEYAFRPRQIFTRLRRLLTPLPATAVVTLPWGDVVRVCPQETIGAEIWYCGVFDLPVAETLWRLLDAGETALDVGANLGQMTSLLRCKAGPAGRVLAFEPHPQLFAALEFLRDTPANQRPGATLELFRAGLSDAAGEAWLDPGTQWQANHGLGRVTTADSGGRAVPIQLSTLDETVPADTRVGVAKVDVEGHEMAVLRGAARLLERRAIRDWVYEDLAPQPSPVQALLRARGYSIFTLQTHRRGPGIRASDMAAEPADLQHNFLATLDPARAQARLSAPGWQVLSTGGT
ncbi:MAG: FkbM family methyltransferase [Verrucomicrobia bacterium]|nr:FkbM family methyltransferase [Verrucomicrobiota bacterium]